MPDNFLYYGDNLNVLRVSIKDESIDLIYLDPPFNSKATYNILFKTPNGHESDAQITAFEDTWHWGEQAEREFNEIVHQKNTQVTEMIRSFRQFLGVNDVMAYLTMMANRLLELHRVLKQTGTIYLHCDPTASHYLKILMDAIFNAENFRNEIIWWYETGGIPKKDFSRKHDIIFRYTKSNSYTFNAKEIKEKRSDEVLRRIASGIPGATRSTGEYRHPSDVWKIASINAMAKERIGYPTQKPEALLERIIKASSDENDLVLDPFCGCGTAAYMAQKSNRHWIGIDITHLAISLIEKRLQDSFPEVEYEVHGTPKDMDGARDLAKRDKHEFQLWACSLIDAQPFKGKGADSGIDGLLYFQDDKTIVKKIIVSVKGGEHIGVSMIRDLGHVIKREKAAIGLFITLNEPTRPMKEEAAGAGLYESPLGDSFPKIQIITIEHLLDGSGYPRFPFDLSKGTHTFKKAPIAQRKVEQETMFDDE